MINFLDSHISPSYIIHLYCYIDFATKIQADNVGFLSFDSYFHECHLVRDSCGQCRVQYSLSQTLRCIFIDLCTLLHCELVAQSGVCRRRPCS